MIYPVTNQEAKLKKRKVRSSSPVKKNKHKMRSEPQKKQQRSFRSNSNSINAKIQEVETEIRRLQKDRLTIKSKCKDYEAAIHECHMQVKRALKVNNDKESAKLYIEMSRQKRLSKEAQEQKLEKVEQNIKKLRIQLKKLKSNRFY